MTLSVIILTKNSAKTVKQCLDSISFADEIVVVDNHSTDETVAIVKNFPHPNLKLISRDFTNDYAALRNFALSKTIGEWILFVDSDEEVTPELKQEIKAVVAQNKGGVNGYYLNRDDYFLGKKLKHGETAHISLLRLGRKDAGSWKGKVHEIWEVKGGQAKLKHSLLHHKNLTISEFLTKLNLYSSIRAQELYEQGIKEPLIMLFLKPKGKFIFNYIVKDGLLDGFPGLVMAFLMSWHSLLVRVKLRLLWMNNGKTEFIPTQ